MAASRNEIHQGILCWRPCLSMMVFGILFLVSSSTTDAFSPLQILTTSSRTTTGQSNHERMTKLYADNVNFDGGGMKGTALETIEFKIFPDGRVEEVVRGVKGGSCNDVTDSINEALGKVVESQPTEELYENEVVIDNTVTNTVDSNSNGGGSDASWEGKSSW